MTKKADNEWVVKRFANVELRIGNNDESRSLSKQLTRNPVAGHYAGGNKDPKAIFTLGAGVDGRYLTLQLLDSGTLDVGELAVFNAV